MRTKKTGKRLFARKCLRRDLLTGAEVQSRQKQEELFQVAAADLAVEAHLLASLGDHPNILKIRGWTMKGPKAFENGRHDSFFLVLDVLEETLDRRMKKWRQQRNDDACESSSNKLTTEKTRIVTEIAAALEHVHSRGVIYRDLKPQNVGFRNDTVKLFDFGLSRELVLPPSVSPPSSPSSAISTAAATTTTTMMTDRAGTPRYMAPEVLSKRGPSYGFPSDVYSWSIVAWEIFTEQKPFAEMTSRDQYIAMVCDKGYRPDISTATDTASNDDNDTDEIPRHNIPEEMKPLLERSWSSEPSDRPTMSKTVAELRSNFNSAPLIATKKRKRESTSDAGSSDDDDSSSN